MTNEDFLFLLWLIRKGLVVSVTINRNIVTIRIKNDYLGS